MTLSRQSPLVKWFSNQESETPAPLFCGGKGPAPGPPDLKKEMERHSAKLCARIGLTDQPGGYLLVGAHESGKDYSHEERAFSQALANDIAIEIKKQSYYRASHYDPLTNLLNRQLLGPELETLIKNCETNKGRFALCMIDLDNFKYVNDAYGHQAGDEVLKVVAQILRKSVRESDLAFRYGGEEFLIILNSQSRSLFKTHSAGDFKRYSHTAVERLRQRIALQPVRLAQHTLQITASIGMTIFDAERLTTKEQIIEEADKAVYVSKHSGKNRVTFYRTEPESPH